MTVNLAPNPVSGPIPSGVKGDTGVRVRGAWTSGMSCVLGDLVTRFNSLWIATAATTVAPSFNEAGTSASTDWVMLVDGRGTELAGEIIELVTAARDAAIAAEGDAQTWLSNVLAAERRIRAQDLGDFADDASALAWAAAQTPAISVVVGSSYWNTTTEIKRICSDSTTTPKTFVDEDADAQTQRTNANTAAVAAAGSEAAAAASLATFQTYFKGALSSDPLVVVATGAFYFNTTSNRWRIKTASGWADYDGADAAAAAAASLNSLNLKWLGSMSLDPTFAGDGGPPGGTGTFYFNQSSHKLRIYYSDAWHDYDEAAQAAAVAAAGALASFNQKWLGSLEVDPSFAGGSPPGGTGVIYFNSYTHKLRIWDGSAWVNYDASAQAAASSAAASLTSFTQKWLGALEVDPAFSSPPSVGTLYWNSTIGNLRLWNGASWVDFTESAQTAAEIASLTSFSVAMATAYANQSARILALTN